MSILLRVILAFCGIITGFGLMIEAAPAIKMALITDAGYVHFLVVILTGIITGSYYYFLRHLASGVVSTLMVYCGLGAALYLTIFTALFAESLTHGIGGNLIGYAMVYVFAIMSVEYDNERPHPNRIRD